MDKTLSTSQIKVIYEHMIGFEKMQIVKAMISQLGYLGYEVIPISKKIVRY